MQIKKNRYYQLQFEAGKHIVDCNGYPCGVYESKKRCLEIIDEIQKLLPSVVVYEMPEK